MKFRKSKNSLKTRKKVDGYTLIEVLLYLTLTTFILVTLSGFFAVVSSMRNQQAVREEVDSQGRYIVSEINSYLFKAKTITVPVDGASGSSLQFTIPGAASAYILQTSGTQLTLGGPITTYNLNSTRVQISNFTVTNLSTSPTHYIVSYSFTLSYTNPNGAKEFDYSKVFRSSVTLR